MTRVFILGAGFSAGAGLPLARDLWPLIRQEARSLDVPWMIDRDLADYLDFIELKRGHRPAEDAIDFEDFVAFLDTEHYLGLRDSYFQEGDRAQTLIRFLIAKILYLRQRAMTAEQRAVYERFARVLRPRDIVITFNYDTILEDALARARVPFRFTQCRLKRPGIVDTSVEEVVILKVHGSIDWFDRTGFAYGEEQVNRGSWLQPGPHQIFDNPHYYHIRPIVPNQIDVESSLNCVYRAHNLDAYFTGPPRVDCSPLLVSPSSAKILYLNPLREHWHRLKGLGRECEALTVIGFSFPPHDDYAMIPLIQFIANFQRWNICADFGRTAASMEVVDRQLDPIAQAEFRDRLRFIDWERTNQRWTGFSDAYVEALRSSGPHSE